MALLDGNRTCAMGEAVRLNQQILYVKLPDAFRERSVANPALLVRDAARLADGFLGTAAPFSADKAGYLPAPEMTPLASDNGNGGPRFVGRVGTVDVALANGVLGDPLLHVRLRHQRRSLLFDLGEGSRLPARVAHQVTDVFISHAHMDHIGGFLWLLRSRIGKYPPCRIYGPPGIADNIEGMVRGILWDRVGDTGPRFRFSRHTGQPATPYGVGTQCPHVYLRGVVYGT